MMSIKDWQKTAHELAKKKGWYDKGKTKSDIESLMMMVSEISEAVEELRKGTKPLYIKKKKPEGELIELADLFLRLVCYCEWKGYDLEKAVLIKHSFNTSRPYRHGSKLF